MGRKLFACVRHLHAFWAGKLGVSSVMPSDDAKKRKKEKSIKFHKLFVLKYIFSVSDPQLFYWVEKS
jgi:hypothetical protein